MLDRLPDSERPLLLFRGVASSDEEPVLRVVPAATTAGVTASAVFPSVDAAAGIGLVVVSAGVVAAGSTVFSWVLPVVFSTVFSAGFSEVLVALDRDRDRALLPVA